MIQKVVLLAILTLVGHGLSLAQTEFLSIREQKMKLTDQPFTITEVVDNRDHQGNIGWIKKGAAGEKVNVNFPNTLETEVFDFLKKNLKPKGPNLRVVVNKLDVLEKTIGIGEAGYCELSLDFFVEVDGATYWALQTTQVSESKGATTIGTYRKNIAWTFKLCFDQLAKIDLTNANNLVKLDQNTSLTEIPDSVKFNFPMFHESLKTGIFANFDELKNNSPSSTEDFRLEKKERTQNRWEGTYEVIPRFEETSKKVRRVWGIAHEGQVYVFHNGEFFPLTIEDYQIYFYGYGIPDNSSIAAAGMVGGLLGAGIAAGVDNAKIKRQKYLYRLDPNTGNFIGAAPDEK